MVGFIPAPYLSSPQESQSSQQSQLPGVDVKFDILFTKVGDSEDTKLMMKFVKPISWLVERELRSTCIFWEGGMLHD